MKKTQINAKKDVPCSLIERVNIVKISVLPTAVYRFSADSIKILMAFFSEIEQINLKYLCTTKDLKLSKQS